MAQSVPPSDELERRIRAAAGYAKMSVEAFAETVGIGKSTLYRIFNGERHIKEMELRHMANRAELPYEFFLVDFQLDLPAIWDRRSSLEASQVAPLAPAEERRAIERTLELMREATDYATRQLEEARAAESQQQDREEPADPPAVADAQPRAR